MSTISKVAIVSANEIEREGLRRILVEQSMPVAGVFGCHLDLLVEGWSEGGSPPLLVILDALPQEQAVTACRDLRERLPGCRLVILATNCECGLVAEAFHAGVDGYVDKAISCASLVGMLRLVALGEKLIPPHLIFELPSSRAAKDPACVDIKLGDVNLSGREIAILQGLIRGEPNKVISRRLMITEATVKVHVKSILRKLGVLNRTQAAVWGIACGLGEAPAMNGEGGPAHAAVAKPAGSAMRLVPTMVPPQAKAAAAAI